MAKAPKVGQSYWKATARENDDFEFTGHVDFEEYVITCVGYTHITLIQKINGVTWIKGKWANKIHKSWKIQQRLENFPNGNWGQDSEKLCTTKLAAIRHRADSLKKTLRSTDPSDKGWIAQMNRKELPIITRKLSRMIAENKRDRIARSAAKLGLGPGL